MKKLLTALLLCLALPVLAQTSNDFGMDIAVDAEKKICKGLDFELDVNARTQNMTRNIERLSVGGALSYKALNTKHFDLKIGAGWEFLWQYGLSETKDHIDSYEILTLEGMETVEYKDGYNTTRACWRPRHRTSLSLAGTWKPNKRWSVSLKETGQYNHFTNVTKFTDRYRYEDEDDPSTVYLKDTREKETGSKDRFVLRSKLSVQYDIRHCPLAPYASFDYGCGLNYAANKIKATAGTDIKLNKTNKFTIFYRFQWEDDDDEPNGHLLGVGYSVKF